MRITAATQRKFETQERLLGKLYDLFAVGEEQHKVSIERLSAVTEETQGTVGTGVKTFADLDILARRVTYDGFQDQNTHLTLLVPLHKAKELLAGWHQRVRTEANPPPYPKGLGNRPAGQKGGRKPGSPWKRSEKQETEERVALAAKPAVEGQELRAVAGPEKGDSPWEVLRPLRKDEARALVEAALQYSGKSKFLKEKIAELQEAGFQADETMFKFERDERLETIALVLPYIQGLLTENERVGTWVTKVKELGNENERLRRERDALRRLNDQYVRERAATQRVAQPAATS
jgi:hypothetical protein